MLKPSQIGIIHKLLIVLRQKKNPVDIVLFINFRCVKLYILLKAVIAILYTVCFILSPPPFFGENLISYFVEK